MLLMGVGLNGLIDRKVVWMLLMGVGLNGLFDRGGRV